MLTHSVAAVALLLAFQSPPSSKAPAQGANALGSLEIEVRISDANGRGATWSTEGPGAFVGTAWVDTGCVPAIAGEVLSGLNGSSSMFAPGKPHEFGWAFTAIVGSIVDGTAKLTLHWERSWEHGTKLAGRVPATPSVYTLRVGERVPLDRLASTDTGQCARSGLKLEVMLTRAVGPSVMQGGRGEFLGPGGQVIFSAADLMQMTPDVAVARGGRGATAPTPKAQGGRGAPDPARAAPPGRAALKAEVWLVHTRPDGVEEVFHHARPFQTTSADFVFPSVTVTTPNGVLMVTVDGTLSEMSLPDTGRTLVVSLTRRVTGPSPSHATTVGDTQKKCAWPAPTDVISIELPPLKTSAGDEIKDHPFSLRIRVGPGPSAKDGQ